jgi:hypothetical protein
MRPGWDAPATELGTPPIPVLFIEMLDRLTSVRARTAILPST